MKSVDMKLHDFNKQNLVGDSKHRDKYKCSVCGVQGFRNGLSATVLLSDKDYKISQTCSFYNNTENTKRPAKVLLDDMPYIGIKEGVYDVVAIPEKYKEQYPDSVWVFSKIRNEPVRILPNEIIDSQ